MADSDGPTEGFLSRWSRRKREIDRVLPDAEAVPEKLPEAVEPSEPVESDIVDEELEANRLAAEAVDLETLGKDDDFTVFLKRGVPELLRRTALRKLWRTDPVFANIDGLNDYDEDFRNPAHNAYKSLWKIGRGFLTTSEQTAQHDSGRISRPVEEDAATAEELEVLQDGGEELQEDDQRATSPDVSQALPVATPGPDLGAGEEVRDITKRQKSEPEEAEPQQKRVSIRSRLAG